MKMHLKCIDINKYNYMDREVNEMVNITIQYRDGGKDFFPNIASHSVNDRILVIEESNNRFVHIVFDTVTFFVVEEVK